MSMFYRCTSCAKKLNPNNSRCECGTNKYWIKTNESMHPYYGDANLSEQIIVNFLNVNDNIENLFKHMAALANYGIKKSMVQTDHQSRELFTFYPENAPSAPNAVIPDTEKDPYLKELATAALCAIDGIPSGDKLDALVNCLKRGGFL
jgi:hypothetical protein